LTRRRRHVAVTVGFAALFLLVAAVVLWLNRPDEQYRPGEEIEGLTAELRRQMPSDVPEVSFTDVTAEAGIGFQHFTGVRTAQLPEDMGSGAAWGDYDNDGWPDLYVANLAGPLTLSPDELDASGARAALYHNERDGTFTEVGAAAGVDLVGMGMGAAWGDYDNDGWADLLVSAYGQNTLFHNNRDGTFEDRTAEAGLAGLVGFWAGVSWSDYDRDGFLDVYVAGYVRYSPGAGASARQYDVEVPASLNPSAFHPERNLLFRNEGDGTFAEVADEAGVSGSDGRSLTAAWADFNHDGWPDLYVANDVSDNALYHNLGDGTFRDVSLGALVADYRGAMGLAVGDWDADGDTDLFVTHWIAQENALYNSLHTRLIAADSAPIDPMRFMDQAERYGLGQIALDYIGWGTSFFDYDNDGRLDLLVVNGSTLQQSERPELLEPMPDQLFWNRSPDDGFYDVSSVSGAYFDRELVGRGAAFGDYDNDGDVDVFIVNNGGPGVLLRNDGGNRNRWLEVRLEGGESNRSAIGTQLRLHAGGAVQAREVGAQSSYLSQNSPVAHFGLGEISEIDSLEIRWPAGGRQVFQDLSVDQIVRVVEGSEPVLVSRGPGDGTEGGEAREMVLRFWELYRSATRHRIEGRPREAADEYARALQLRPDHWDGWYYRGNLLFELNDFDGAREAWERLVDLNPSSARGHTQLGVLHACFERGQFDLEAAEARFQRALDINKEETGPLLWLGKTALMRGDLPGARDYLETLLRSNVESSEAHYLNGYVAWKEGATAEAEASFTSALLHSAPPEEVDQELVEGGTRTGRAMLAAGSTCRPIRTQVQSRLQPTPDDPDNRDIEVRMSRAYAELEGLLEQAGRPGSRG
jgi:tetratricopeptide (TPR) repeat protein